MSEWKPIETAPKDGKEFLACWARQAAVMQIVKFDRIHHVWKTKGEVLAGFSTNATHWMPLPPPPNPNTTEQKGE